MILKRSRPVPKVKVDVQVVEGHGAAPVLKAKGAAEAVEEQNEEKWVGVRRQTDLTSTLFREQ